MYLSEYKEITKNSYERTAQDFADKVSALAPKESIERFTNNLPPNPKILDIGCGSGRDALLFSNKGASVVGIDFCPAMIEIAQKQAPLAEFHLMDMDALDFAKDSFDGVWAACSLNHLSKQALPQVLNSVYQLLKEKGCFYLTFKQGSGEVLEQYARYNGEIKKFWSFYEEEELLSLLEQASFKILSCDLIEKTHSYHTHAAFRIFCQK